MSLIKLKVLSAPLSTITDFSIITTGRMGAANREREKEKERERKQICTVGV